ncbi:hypothetical protein GCM10010116_61830 [Microbispora rosea subsp. aerata]|nr:hypothetical protein GCM10010116_61830 [Microbispora rosea subsp. aerata]GIH59170.1 hypothetical protein Mro02_60840 [Microbispora rosea subsp. aerata]GLJ86773.1 hypothetical protein GCM10017588_55140 [Microbispora rosea subsp. aerata]
MHNGAVIVIDDGGVGRHEEELRRAALLLAGAMPVDILRMGDLNRSGFRGGPEASIICWRKGEPRHDASPEEVPPRAS